MTQPAEIPPVVRDPYTVWLRTLEAGAIIGALAATLSACWCYALLSSRLQGVPRHRMIEAAYPFVVLTEAALTWMGSWLLTTRWPLYEPARERQFVARLRRLRALLLRLIVSAVFITWSLRVWGLIGPSGRLSVNYKSFNLIMAATELGGFFLLWAHLFSMARQIKLRRVAWRAMTVLIIVGGCMAVFNVAPLAADAGSRPIPLSPNEINIRFALFVVIDSMAALTMGRYVWALSRAAKESMKRGVGDGIV